MKPKTMIWIGIGLAVFAGAGKLYEMQKQTSDPFANRYDHIQIKTRNVVNIGTPYQFFDGDTLVMTTPVTKEDPYVRVYSVYLGYDVQVDGKKQETYEYSRVSGLDFGQDLSYSTVAFKNMDQNAVIEISPKYDEESDLYTDSIEDYSYLTDDDTHDQAEILQAWRQQQEETADKITITSQGNGTVDWQVQTADGKPSYLYGTFLLCFMNGNTCIYSEEITYEGIHEQDVSVSGTYRCKYQLPAYDRVDVLMAS